MERSETSTLGVPRPPFTEAPSRFVRADVDIGPYGVSYDVIARRPNGPTWQSVLLWYSAKDTDSHASDVGHWLGMTDFCVYRAAG